MGKKYLKIQLVGHEAFVAFENEKTSVKQPDYSAPGVAVWLNESQDKPKEA